MNVLELVGKRCLLKVGEPRYRDNYIVNEFRILEVSPSGNWVKLQNLNGNKFWQAIVNVSFVEELLDLKAERPQ